MSNYTTTMTVDQSPGEVFIAINDVRGWWSQEITGDSAQVDDEFEFEVVDVHYSKIRLTEVVPGRRIVWHVDDANLTFVDDATEWTGTDIVFDLTAQDDGGTEVRFTHVGLQPAVECYDMCSAGWDQYVNGSLRDLISTGRGNPHRRDDTIDSEMRKHEAHRDRVATN